MRSWSVSQSVINVTNSDTRLGQTVCPAPRIERTVNPRRCSANAVAFIDCVTGNGSNNQGRDVRAQVGGAAAACQERLTAVSTSQHLLAADSASISPAGIAGRHRRPVASVPRLGAACLQLRVAGPEVFAINSQWRRHERPPRRAVLIDDKQIKLGGTPAWWATAASGTSSSRCGRSSSHRRSLRAPVFLEFAQTGRSASAFSPCCGGSARCIAR